MSSFADKEGEAFNVRRRGIKRNSRSSAYDGFDDILNQRMMLSLKENQISCPKRTRELSIALYGRRVH